jgi:hypothetical protein
MVLRSAEGRGSGASASCAAAVWLSGRRRLVASLWLCGGFCCLAVADAVLLHALLSGVFPSQLVEEDCCGQ